MATKERSQNPVVNDTINLRLFAYNSNNLADFASVNKVDIYYLDREEVSAENPEGRRLVETFDGTAVTQEDTGTYVLPVNLEFNRYVIGTYLDIWDVNASAEDPSNSVQQVFEVYPNLWYTTPIPVVYDFNFVFQPNKFRKGSKQYLIIEILPNVPTAGELRKYYENLAIVSDLNIFIEQSCGECMPAEQDLRRIVDDEPVSYREKRFGYYQIDTEEMDCGIYDIWFKLEFGGNVYISARNKFQVYD